jgi:hypothetical protein
MSSWTNGEVTSTSVTSAGVREPIAFRRIFSAGP